MRCEIDGDSQVKLQVRVDFTFIAQRLLLLNLVEEVAELVLVVLYDSIEAVLQALHGILMIHRHNRLVELGLNCVIKHLVAQVTRE